MFKRFQGSKNYRIKEIDTTFANKFLNWMLTEKGYSQSYSLKIISDLKTTCNDAGYYGIETNIQLKNIKAPSTRNDNIIYLTPEELKQIEDTELKRDALINARRWLILGVHIGQRGKDLVNLNESNLKVRENLEVIELTQAKGNKPVTIPLPQKARDILVTGFPRKIHLATFNKHLKALCKIAEINTPTIGRKSIGKGDKRPQGTYPKHELISSHVCRRTFATNYYAVLPTPLLMRITGHSTEKMLLNYLGKSSIDYIQQIADYYQAKETKDKQKDSVLRVIKNQA
jgi:integrase